MPDLQGVVNLSKESSSGKRIEYRGNVLTFGDVAGDHKGTIRRCTYNGLDRLVKFPLRVNPTAEEPKRFHCHQLANRKEWMAIENINGIDALRPLIVETVLMPFSVPGLEAMLVRDRPRLSVMKEARTLDEFIESGELTEENRMTIYGELALAIGLMHSCGITNGDVKTSNVLMEGGHPKLVDFGYAICFDPKKANQKAQFDEDVKKDLRDLFMLGQDLKDRVNEAKEVAKAKSTEGDSDDEDDSESTESLEEVSEGQQQQDTELDEIIRGVEQGIAGQESVLNQLLSVTGRACLVCGAKMHGIHYGVKCCAGCKMFFRRFYPKRDSLNCKMKNDASCKITANTRDQCNACRMSKCLEVGMKMQK